MARPVIFQPIAERSRPGRLLVGTSGFAYPGWIPRFYPAGAKASDLLRLYGERLPAVELNNTFYQQPTAAKVAAWLAATPADLRFSVKAQRGGSFRALAGTAGSGLAWLTDPYRAFGDRLGTVLFRVPAETPRDDAKLEALLSAWPRDLPLTMEFQDPSWQVDETFSALTRAGAACCATDVDGGAEPDLRRTGPFIYVRLRRAAYDEGAVEHWAARLEPFLDDGLDVYVFVAHDAVGRGGETALALAAAVARRRG